VKATAPLVLTFDTSKETCTIPIASLKYAAAAAPVETVQEFVRESVVQVTVGTFVVVPP
jgi:uncharacterized membrane protein